MEKEEVEKELYKYREIYLIKEEFPVQVQIIEDVIEWKNQIIFDKMSETVSFSSNNYYDSDMLAWILQKMEELNFKKFFKT